MTPRCLKSYSESPSLKFRASSIMNLLSCAWWLTLGDPQMDDCLKCQTATATPAEPGVSLVLLGWYVGAQVGVHGVCSDRPDLYRGRRPLRRHRTAAHSGAVNKRDKPHCSVRKKQHPNRNSASVAFDRNRSQSSRLSAATGDGGQVLTRRFCHAERRETGGRYVLSLATPNRLWLDRSCDFRVIHRETR